MMQEELEKMYEEQERQEYKAQQEAERKRLWAMQQRERVENRFNAIETRLNQIEQKQQEFSLIEAIKEQNKEAEVEAVDYGLEDVLKQRRKLDVDALINKEYMLFCFWCNTEHAICKYGKDGAIDVHSMKQNVYNNAKYLIEYIKKEKPNGFGRILPDCYIQRKMLEKYFGYTFQYEEQENKWRIFKKQVEIVEQTLSK